MSKVTKDNKFIMIQVPDRDIKSMTRFIAHAFVANQIEDQNKIADLMRNIVFGDLTKQDEFVNQLAHSLDLDNWVLVYSTPEALELCDELADRVYEELPKPEPEKHLRIAKICVECHRGYIETHECAQGKI